MDQVLPRNGRTRGSEHDPAIVGDLCSSNRASPSLQPSQIQIVLKAKHCHRFSTRYDGRANSHSRVRASTSRACREVEQLMCVWKKSTNRGTFRH